MSLGLTTYRWNNNIKSMLMLAALPLLLVGLLAAFFWTVGYFSLDAHGKIDVATLGLFGFTSAISSPSQLATQGVEEYWHIALGIAAAWVAVGFFFNTAMINRATGAKTVSRTEEPELYNLLENLCISRGLKMPQLGIVETDALNAFASGIGDNSYRVTVTRGIVRKLDKEELEAVLAHELSHIQNRDVRLLIITIVFTGMLSFMAQMMWRNLRFASDRRGSDGKRGGGTMAIILIAAVTLAVGYLLAMLLRFAISRKREYLADAGAVDLTKNPDALISALEKISGNADIPNVPPEVQQMFIENPPSIFGLFDTHPPIPKRIEILRQLGGLPDRGESIIPKAG